MLHPRLRAIALVLALGAALPALAQPAPDGPPPATPVAPGAVPSNDPAMMPPPPAPAWGENSVNISPLGVLFGSYALNFEHLVDGRHGLIAEGQFSSSSNEDAKSTSFGAGIGYRYHWSGSQDSGFVGAMAAYQVGTGNATVTTSSGGTQSFDLGISAASVTANIGRRWAWEGGFNVTLRFGVGRAWYDISSDSSDPNVQEAIRFTDALLNALPVALDGELSIGWIF